MKILSTVVLLGMSGLVFFSCNTGNPGQKYIEGLWEPVEILRDEWGVNHIYAKNQHDLFFAQGYAAAKDRLFQFEVWRRQATGTVAEILGERELKRDIGTRLFLFRGDLAEEMNHYHENGAEIITAYANGVNACIEEIMKTPEKLPLEFKMLGIFPKKWTPGVVISRHQGLLGNINEEVLYGRAVAKLGAEKVKDLSWFHPNDPEIELNPKINKKLLFDDILGLYNAYRTRVCFQKEDIQPEYRTTENISALREKNDLKVDNRLFGSNNWVVSKKIMADNNTYMANDPHRTIAIPSLRYMVHLSAPGWNVIGGGEPEIPGISIGHNEYGAWGLTRFRTDGEDMYIYDLNPDNINQYRYNGEWLEMTTVPETFKVKNSKSVTVDLLYTRHGPVTYVDSVHKKAYAVRCAWLEPGGAPYLASLRMNQAKNWEEFRSACNYSHIPGLNMVWADKKGSIGWQVVGIAPIRPNHSGLVPVPGNGEYEWEGYLPIIKKPNKLNPLQGYFKTANENLTPKDYEHWNAIGYYWTVPYRGMRIKEVLESGKKLTMDDLKALQTDYLSIPARILTPYLTELQLEGRFAKVRNKMENWDYKLESGSTSAAIYVAWENQIRLLAEQKFIPKEGKGLVTLQMKKIIDWVVSPDDRFGSNPVKGRDRFLIEAFYKAVEYLETTLGMDMENWQYGQADLKHCYIEHPLADLVNEELKPRLNLRTVPRGGNEFTVNFTSPDNNQSNGASFRMIVNTGNWDSAVATNCPGQSGNPESPFYGNLFELWANDQYFPLYFSRSKIDSITVNKTVLIRKNGDF